MNFIQTAYNNTTSTISNAVNASLNLVGLGESAGFDQAAFSEAIVHGNNFIKKYTVVDTSKSCVDMSMVEAMAESAAVDSNNSTNSNSETASVEAALAAGGKEIKILSPEELKKAINNIPKKK